MLGTLTRSAIYKDHVAALAFNNDGTLLGCQGSETTFDLFTVFSKDDVDSYKNVKMEDDKKIGYTTSDFFSPLESITAKDKIKSFAFDAATPTRQFMLSLGNNSVQVYKVSDFNNEFYNQNLFTFFFYKARSPKSRFVRRAKEK